MASSSNGIDSSLLEDLDSDNASARLVSTWAVLLKGQFTAAQFWDRPTRVHLHCPALTSRHIDLTPMQCLTHPEDYREVARVILRVV